MKKEKTEAPTKDPTRGKVAEAPLDGPGAGAGTSVLEAKAALMEAAAMRTAHEIFLASMANIQIMRIAIYIASVRDPPWSMKKQSFVILNPRYLQA